MRQQLSGLVLAAFLTAGCAGTKSAHSDSLLHPWVSPGVAARAKAQPGNPLIGVWFRVKAEGLQEEDRGQILVVRSDGTAFRHDSPQLLRAGMTHPMPYAVDEAAATFTYERQVFRYEFVPDQRYKMLRLTWENSGRKLVQTYVLMTSDL